jgi:DegV family protein with EDD domain
VLQYDIKLVPTQLIVDERPYRDRVELTSAGFFQGLRATPQAFTDAYRDAARVGEHVIAVILSSALSGTYGNAEAAARRLDQGKVTVFESRSATLGEGLLVVRGVELAAAGWSADAIVKELQSQTGDGAYYRRENRANRAGARKAGGEAPHPRAPRPCAHPPPHSAPRSSPHMRVGAWGVFYQIED